MQLFICTLTSTTVEHHLSVIIYPRLNRDAGLANLRYQKGPLRYMLYAYDKTYQNHAKSWCSANTLLERE